MNKERIEGHIKTIKKWLTRFDKNTYRNGKNRTIREKAGREIHLVLMQANQYFDRNEDIRGVLFDLHGGNAFGYGESLSYQWFDRDMPRLLSSLRDTLQNIEHIHENN